ncbi:hypothetical protein MycrhDRAFT_3271 [Mycolicibacterium rhodesiae JS60]|nr:hypothetical protein MycrhDRAFT_3271 [Mycolicibacterium rhodesiae JS60]
MTATVEGKKALRSAYPQDVAGLIEARPLSDGQAIRPTRPSVEKKRNTVAERNANQFAFDTLFGPDGIEPFLGLTSDREIVAAARRIGVAPGVAMLQMHRKRLLDYNLGNRLCFDIKDTFTA